MFILLFQFDHLMIPNRKVYEFLEHFPKDSQQLNKSCSIVEKLWLKVESMFTMGMIFGRLFKFGLFLNS